MSFNTIRESEILAKISQFTVHIFPVLLLPRMCFNFRNMSDYIGTQYHNDPDDNTPNNWSSPNNRDPSNKLWHGLYEEKEEGTGELLQCMQLWLLPWLLS